MSHTFLDTKNEITIFHSGTCDNKEMVQICGKMDFDTPPQDYAPTSGMNPLTVFIPYETLRDFVIQTIIDLKISQLEGMNREEIVHHYFRL